MPHSAPALQQAPSLPGLRERAKTAVREAQEVERALRIDETLRPLGRAGLWAARQLSDFYVELFGPRWGGTRAAKLVLLVLPLYLAYVARKALLEQLERAVPILFTGLLILTASVFRAIALKYATIGAWLEDAQTHSLRDQLKTTRLQVQRLESPGDKRGRQALKAAVVKLEGLIAQAREVQDAEIECDSDP